MKRPHSKGSWFILVKITLNQTCKITLKIIFNQKISKKDYCSKRCIWCLFFPLYQKRPPLVLVEERWEPGIEMRFIRESSSVFRKNAPCFFFFLPAFWILLTSLNKIKYCILDVVKKTQQNKNWLLTTLRLILLLKKNLQHVQMVIGLLCSGGLWRYKGIRIRERGTRLWCSRHCSKHLTYITSFDPHSNLWGLLLTLFEFYRKRNQGWESNFNKISRMLSVQAGQSVTWAWSLARQALLKLYAQTCKNTPLKGTKIWSSEPQKL